MTAVDLDVSNKKNYLKSIRNLIKNEFILCSLIIIQNLLEHYIKDSILKLLKLVEVLTVIENEDEKWMKLLLLIINIKI